MPVRYQKPQFFAWSFSRLHQWEECPLRAKLKLIDKRTEPEGPALARGNAIHKEAEKFASGQVRALPQSLVQMKDEFKELKKAKPLVEQQWAFTVNWEPTEWFGKDAWLRVICDAVTVSPPNAVVIDHKTGKLREGYNDQVELFALAALAKFQDVSTVRTELWYLDHGVIKDDEFNRSMEKKLRTKWEKRARPMLADTTFAPRPGFHCRWCHFSKSKGGPCKY
jgi:PD-(D/E)XK nuclease superfamily